VFDRYVASFDGAATKRSLKLTENQSMLLAVAWVTDEEHLLMQMFPEVWFMDVTSGTNKEGRGLFLVAGKDSNNNAFTGVMLGFSYLLSNFGCLIGFSGTVYLIYLGENWFREIAFA